MSKTPAHVILAVVLAAMVIGLLAFARGDDHHHGDDVGAISRPTQVLGPRLDALLAKTG